MKSKHSRPHGTRNTPAMGNSFPSLILLSLSGLSLLLLTGTSQATDLTASDGAANDIFGDSVSQSGDIGLVGAFGDNLQQGSAYVFRNLDTATGTVTQNVKLTASDGAASDYFGLLVSLSGNIGLVGALNSDIGANLDQGSAYIFRNLNTATGTVTQNVKLTASDGAAYDNFGLGVSLSGNIGLVGALYDDIGANSNQGSAYVFRNLDTATGTVTENVKLTSSDGATDDYFGHSVSLSEGIGLVGAYGKSNYVGSAYVFRNLDTATGTVTENVKLTASDRESYNGDNFGFSVSLSGNIGIVGAHYDNGTQGSAYVFRNLDTATGTVTENVKLTASDAASDNYFGSSVSLSGNIGLIGAWANDIGSNSDQGAAYVFRSLNIATGAVTQNVKLTASDGAASDHFGLSVSLDGDNFIIGASGKNSYIGKAYSGSVSSITTLDSGSTSKTISGISFVSQDDWIIGDTSDDNQVILSSGDSANVTAAGKSVFIGKNAGSDNNTLIVAGSLTANQITIGAAGNTGNTLQIGTGGTTGTLSPASVITNNGSLIFNRSGTITQGTDFSSAAITGTGSVTQAGPGTTVLNAANTYTGGTIVKSGTLSVGTGGSISHTAADIIIGNTNGDSGALTITGGSVSGRNGYIGFLTGSAGTVTVSSGTWTNTNLSVGYSGTATMIINGGTVSNQDGQIGDGTGTGNGSVIVSSGAWNNLHSLRVGNWDTGHLTISGGTVTSENAFIGAHSDAHGTADVSSGSWSNTNGLVVGSYGTGTMNITGGNVTDGYASIGNEPGSHGTVAIANGMWSSTNHLLVGNAGTGVLNITGGSANNDIGTLGLAAGSSGTGTISGGNWINRNHINLGLDARRSS